LPRKTRKENTKSSGIVGRSIQRDLKTRCAVDGDFSTSNKGEQFETCPPAPGVVRD
jgi:hypothetical protein